MSLKIYNIKTKSKEVFKPLKEGHVKMYVCGPTVYDLLHIGNFRGAIFFNLVRNWLEKTGYKVSYLYNYTDVDDKIINRANKDGKTWKEISTTYIKEFEKDFELLKLKPHTKNPRASDCIKEIVTFIEKLITKKRAYEVDGNVYFDIRSFKTYGQLSNKNIEDLESGFRININERKKHPVDFALWKAAKPDEPSWPSPWGEGRPGWHIECSTMIHTYLGDSIDIHGGGMDLIFPHHENEVAQSEGLTGKPFVQFWMHNNMLEFGRQKMSKSLGNIQTGRNFLEMYNGEILKYMMLSSHYRSIIDFSPAQVDRSLALVAKFYSSLSLAKKQIAKDLPLAAVPEKFQKCIERAGTKIEEALNDDFNTPEVIASLFEVLKLYNNLCHKHGKITAEQKAIAEVFYPWIKKQCEAMALFQEDPDKYLKILDDLLLKKLDIKRTEVDSIFNSRNEARKNKDFKKSDELRDQLKAMGVSVMDGEDNSTWEVHK